MDSKSTLVNNWSIQRNYLQDLSYHFHDLFHCADCEHRVHHAHFGSLYGHFGSPSFQQNGLPNNLFVFKIPYTHRNRHNSQNYFFFQVKSFKLPVTIHDNLRIFIFRLKSPNAVDCRRFAMGRGFERLSSAWS